MMSKQEAAKILGVKPGSNRYEIENRYTLLAKRYRGKSDETSRKEIERFTMAFDILMDRYVEPEPEDPKMQEVIMGKTRKEWANRWHYGRLPLIVSLIVVALLASMIYSIVTNKHPDYTLAVYGDFYQSRDSALNSEFKLEKLIREQNPEITYPNVQFNLLTERQGVDGQVVYGSQMKRMLMITGAEKVDVLILDRSQYENLVPQGILYPLDEFIGRLDVKLLEGDDPVCKLLKYTLSAEVLPDGEKPVEHIYGLDVSRDQLLNSLDILGQTQILCVCWHGEHKESAYNSIERLLESKESWYDPQQMWVKQGRLLGSKEAQVATETVSSTTAH